MSTIESRYPATISAAHAVRLGGSGAMAIRVTVTSIP